METTMLGRLAKALKAEAETFSDPVHLYVKSEARNRLIDATPDAEQTAAFWDQLEGREEALELESWAILVRTLLNAMRKPDEATYDASMKDEGCGCPCCVRADSWPHMIDHILSSPLYEESPAQGEASQTLQG